MLTSEAYRIIRETQRTPVRVQVAVRYSRIARESARDARRIFEAERLLKAVAGVKSRTELRALELSQLTTHYLLLTGEGLPIDTSKTRAITLILDVQKRG